MDSQVVAMDVSKTRTDDSTKTGIEIVPTKTTEMDQKTNTDRTDAAIKQAVRDKSAKTCAKPGRSKKQKLPVSTAVEEESSDSDSATISSSDSSSDTDTYDSSSSVSGEKQKKKHRSKKRHESEKAKKKLLKAKRSKRPVKTLESEDSGSDSDSESSDSDVSGDSLSSSGDEDKKDKSSKKSHRNRKLQLQAQQQQQDLARLLLLQQQQQQHQQHQQPPPPMPRYDPYQQYTAPMYYGAHFGNPAMNSYGVQMGGHASNFAQPSHPAHPLGGHDRGLGLRPPPSGINNGLSRGRLHNLKGLIPDNRQRSSRHRRSKTPRLDFKRVDQVWDSTIHNYKLQDTAEGVTDPEYEGYLFHVRRTFDWEGKYKQTVVDIKSKLLRDSLQEVIGDIKGVSLVEEVPKLDPNLLFLYLEDMRKHVRVLKKTKPTGKKKDVKKERKLLQKKTQQLKILVRYLDKDYESVKKKLVASLLIVSLWSPTYLFADRFLV